MKQTRTSRSVSWHRLSLLCLLMLALVLSACSAPAATVSSDTAATEADTAEVDTAEEAAPAGPSNPDAVTITFWNGFGGSDRPVLEDLVNRFNESQDEVYVAMEIMDWELVYQKLATSAASGEGPDFIAFGPENIATYANMGVIVPVDDFYESGRIDESLFPSVFATLTRYEGQRIGIPMNYFAHVLYYNKDLAAAAGLDPETPPTNWDELAEWAVAMTNEAEGQYGLFLPTSWVTLVQLMWENGGDIMDYETKTATMNQPGAVDTISFFADLFVNKKVSPAPNSDGGQMFAAGKLGLLIDGPWQTPQFRESGVNYGIALMPSGPVTQKTFGAGLSYHLTAKGAEDDATREAFYKFAAWWFEKEQQKEWSSRIGFPPVRTDLQDDEELMASNPELAMFMASNDIAQPWLVGIVNSQKILSEVTQKYFDEIFLNNADVATAMEQANQALDAILATER